jgi:hypothetical protein
MSQKSSIVQVMQSVQLGLNPDRRIAFRRNDPELMKALLCGITLWLVVAGLFSAYLGVWFNVGVDIAVLMLFSFPFIKALRF